MLKTPLTAILLTLALAVPAAAKEVVYKCEVRPRSTDNVIEEEMIIGYDAAKQSAWVYTYRIKQIYGKPLDANLAPRDAKSVKLQWDLNRIPSANSNTTFQASYYAIFRPGNKRVSVNATLHGWDNQSGGSGKCEILETKFRS